MEEALCRDGGRLFAVRDQEYGNDVSEVYSPPRVARRAQRHGLRGGWSLHILVMQEGGEAWDLGLPTNRLRALRLKRRRPRLLVGSPM